MGSSIKKEKITVNCANQFRLYTNRKSARAVARMLNAISDKPIVFVEKCWC